MQENTEINQESVPASNKDFDYFLIDPNGTFHPIIVSDMNNHCIWFNNEELKIVKVGAFGWNVFVKSKFPEV